MTEIALDDPKRIVLRPGDTASLGVDVSGLNETDTITARRLPDIGMLQLADGTAVQPGQSLTRAELAELIYAAETPPRQLGSDSFSYDVTRNGETAIGRVSLATSGTSPASLASSPLYHFGEDIYIDGPAPGLGGQDLMRITADGIMERVPDINPVIDDTGLVPEPERAARAGGFRTFNEALYFAADGPLGRELYRITDERTVELVADINPGLEGSRPDPFAVFNGALYLSADGPDGRALHRVTADGTVELVSAEIDPGLRTDAVTFNDALYFFADGPLGIEPYRVNADGTAELVADINPGRAGSQVRDGEVIVGTSFTPQMGSLYFGANGPSGREPYQITPDGTLQLVGDINPGVADSHPHAFVSGMHPSLGENFVYFRANDGTGFRKFMIDPESGRGPIADERIPNLHAAVSFTQNSDVHFGNVDDEHTLRTLGANFWKARPMYGTDGDGNGGAKLGHGSGGIGLLRAV